MCKMGLYCQRCDRYLTISSIPRHAKCGRTAMLCDKCMDTHDCQAAKREDDAWANLRNPD